MRRGRIKRIIRRHTIKHIEQEIFLYHETRRKIEDKRDELMARPALESTGGGRSNLPGDPTGTVAVKMVMAYAEDKELQSMQDIVDAIDYVYGLCTTTEKRLMNLFYWDKTLTLEGVSQKMYISARHLRRMRWEICGRIAKELGWW